MNRDYFNVGVRPKSAYVQGVVRGIGPLTKTQANKEYIKSKNPAVELYAERWEQGLDIWTGKPLEGSDLRDWDNQRSRKLLE
jgi:hypothetical protein|tara:strand:+ start:362 stop:607 length:246 start_codon:yes stop_codon:yes gene_type:complete